jgi:histidinol-phosphate/aromatic aminotransferase/cobyric acid decarboxylase-like protein
VFFEQLEKISYLRPINSQANYILCETSGKSSNLLTEELSFRFNLLIKDCSQKQGFNGGSYVRIAVKNSYENKKMIDALLEIDLV